MKDEEAVEAISQAHDQLHKGNVDQAHELIHKAMGIDNSVEMPARPIAHRRGFDRAFIKACRKHEVKAAFVLVDGEDESGRSRLLAGGDAELCQFLGQLLRGQ